MKITKEDVLNFLGFTVGVAFAALYYICSP